MYITQNNSVPFGSCKIASRLMISVMTSSVEGIFLKVNLNNGPLKRLQNWYTQYYKVVIHYFQ